ncbi:hypothetical protein Cabys_503 [Caldithrix abyssi DSM 13497]|uniref:Uncharacterized protein n=1 Tax=Caldithrix abyssi DSM 13497 TaxID=880073 RepID=A0A1J1C3X9_CALAY|nr:hypothetical protein Cabys_503 [Caldithrix abyssi DSM 13497]
MQQPPGRDLKIFVLFLKLIPQPLLFKKEKGRKLCRFA